jgi:orotate phosphoribosyltransferase
MSFNQKEFNDFILNNNVIGFFKEPITLKSGRKSNWYVNWRTVVEDVFLTDKLTDFILEYINDIELKPDCLYGVPEGATKLGIISQFKYAKKSENYSKGTHVLAMGRAKPKDHGAPKDKFFVGMPTGKVIIIEDVTTTGMSLLATIDSLKESGIDIIAAIGLTNRMELRDDKKSVKQAVEEKGVKYYNMSNALELLPEAYIKHQPGNTIAENIEKEFNEYGVNKLKINNCGL